MGPGDRSGSRPLTITWYPEAGEAFVARPSYGSEGRNHSSVLDIGTQLDHGEETPRSEGRLPQSLRRSRASIRRYAAANGCNLLVSSTYADQHLNRATDRKGVELDCRNMVRRIRRAWGEAFPYLTMPEVQPERSEREGRAVYNGMVLTPRLPRRVFDAVIESWPYGEGDGYNGVDITPFEGARGGARYASKALARYASKGLDVAPAGQQAYRVAQGYQPTKYVDLGASGASAVDLLEVWAEHYGLELETLRAVTDDEGHVMDAAWAMWPPGGAGDRRVPLAGVGAGSSEVEG